MFRTNSRVRENVAFANWQGTSVGEGAAHSTRRLLDLAFCDVVKQRHGDNLLIEHLPCNSQSRVCYGTILHAVRPLSAVTSK